MFRSNCNNNLDYTIKNKDTPDTEKGYLNKLLSESKYWLLKKFYFPEKLNKKIISGLYHKSLTFLQCNDWFLYRIVYFLL